MAMSKEEQQKWKAEKYGYTKAFTAIKGDAVRVTDIEPSHDGQIGYTSSDKTVHLAYDHECMKGLNAQGKRAFRCGVGVHELMHQLLTDFVITNRALVPLPGIEKEILGMISNYVEDARIEHFAYQFVGGTYLKCLEFAIAWTYKTTEKIQEMKTPFQQFMIAMQQFGDQGFLKGRFTFPEAEKAFREAVPIFYKATLETNPRRVMKYSKDIFEISRPLWKDRADLEELMRQLAEAAEKSGKSMHKGGYSGKPSAEASDDEDGDGSSASSRRKMTTKEVSRREYEEASSSKGGKGGGSGEMVKCKDAKTAEEAAEAAAEAAEDAADAQDAADDAKAAADEAKGTSREESAKKAADRAQAAADRAKSAAADAKSHADASAEAKANGDSEGEETNAKQAGRDALRANAAKKSADRADAEANGESGNGSAETAQDAQECADSAESSAQAAEDAAAEAEAKAEEASKSGDEGEAKSAEAAAKRAREAADKAKLAAERAKESAEKAEAAQEAENEAGESANARNAEKAAKEAAREAAKAEAAARGPQHTPGEKANDAELFDYTQAQDGSNLDSQVTDRAINGARPDYSNCEDTGDSDWEPTPTEFDIEDYALSDDDFASIETEIQSCLEAVEREEADASREDSVPLPDFEIKSARFGNATSCLNRRIRVDDVEHAMELYGQLMTKLRPGINSLYGRLRNIFQNDVEVTDYRASGKLNYKRVNSGRLTARVFDKHRLPSEKAKTAIMIMVDESGSMSGRNSETAKQTAIALAETFHRLNVPTYIIGFTADTSGYDAVHNHYVTWKNSMNERLRLLDITARANNFDGYSIRYGGELLKKVNAEHKLMVVVSDGSPACSAYRGSDGIADTKDAIRNVRTYADVLGVLIGSYSVDELQSMYGNDFINVKHVEDLFANLARRIVHIVNKWD